MDRYATAVDRSLPDRALPARFKEPPPIPSHTSFHRKRPTLSTLDVVIEAPRAEEISALSPPRRDSRSSGRDGSSDESPSYAEFRRTRVSESKGDSSRSVQSLALTDRARSQDRKTSSMQPRFPQPLRRSHSTSSAVGFPRRPGHAHASGSPTEEAFYRRSMAYLTELEEDLQHEFDIRQRHNLATREYRQHQRSKSMMESRVVTNPPDSRNASVPPPRVMSAGGKLRDSRNEAPSMLNQSTGLRRATSTKEPRPAAIPPYSWRTQPTGLASSPTHEQDWTRPLPSPRLS